ncbi:MAG: hypothetical protein AAGH90_02135 [Pseudomonadota bacterium]
MRNYYLAAGAALVITACSAEIESTKAGPAEAAPIETADTAPAEPTETQPMEEGLVDGPGASEVTLVRGEPFRGVYPLIECVNEDCIIMMASNARGNAARSPDLAFKPDPEAVLGGFERIDLSTVSPAYSEYDAAWRIGQDPEATDIYLQVIHESQYWDEAPSFLVAQVIGFETTATAYSVLNYPNDKDNFRELFKLEPRMGPQPRVTVGKNGAITVEEFGPDYGEPISSTTRYWAGGDHGEYLATREEMAADFGETLEEIDAMLAAEQ